MGHLLNVAAFSVLVAAAILLTSINAWSFLTWIVKDHFKRKGETR